MSAIPAAPRRRRARPPVANLEEQRRAQIVAAAVAVFTAQGYEDTSMSDIARQAGIGQGTLYRYVAGKRELLDLVFDHSAEQLLDVVRPSLFSDAAPNAPEDILARFDDALTALTAAIDEQPELLALVLVEAAAIDEELKLRALGLEASVAGMVAGLFEDARDAGFLRPGADPAVLGALVAKLMVPAGLREVMGSSEAARRRRYRATMLDFVRHGVFSRGDGDTP
ncbi:TetR/AcrR family transcriptional regulator [Mycolicibacterium brumae]|uniref:TetR/AcrR family transcriptional regulator n=1 Tax=Mycolicibacterium brumae TaxID=85968 RepID=UPI000C145875|nr:TetR/AcrR family transcriptional regulator [Mycolicibacterium brumae]